MGNMGFEPGGAWLVRMDFDWVLVDGYVAVICPLVSSFYILALLLWLCCCGIFTYRAGSGYCCMVLSLRA